MKGNETKMMVISDGDVIKNDLQGGKPLELGFQKYTGSTYGNKEFLLNAVNYLLDDNGLIDIRSKEINLAFLDKDKIAGKKKNGKSSILPDNILHGNFWYCL